MANWFGFDQTRKAVVHTTKVKQLNPNKINRRPALGTVILSLKLVFSGGVLTLEEELGLFMVLQTIRGSVTRNKSPNIYKVAQK